MKKIKGIIELLKLRMTVFILVSVSFGFIYGKPESVSWTPMWWALLGSALLAFACFGINQLLEIDRDGMMVRTQNRPLVKGVVHKIEGWILSLVCWGLGFWILWDKVNLLSAWIGFFIVFSYCFLYTPTKRWTTLNTLIGAIPGSLPPVLGWAAAQNGIGKGAALLFLILFFWQLPHFLAIAWLYREDYSKGKFAMLSVVDDSGESCFRQIIIQTTFLIFVSLMPIVWGLAGFFYLGIALLAGSYFLYKGIVLYKNKSAQSARSLFYYSLLYLPFLLLSLVLDSTVVYL